jgi:FRG domain
VKVVAMPEIEKPSTPFGKPVESVSVLLQKITSWHKDHPIEVPDAHRRVWYRGHEDQAYRLWPGVYRDDFTELAQKLAHNWKWSLERARLFREREMLSEFRTSGATLLDGSGIVDSYFIAQHYGMRTRLLDWTTNPLAALYFAVCSDGKRMDGDLFMMDADKLLPKHPNPIPDDYPLPIGIVTMHHPYATDAVGISFWQKQKKEREPLILPIRPDNRPGRIAQQSSCFTLHMHLSPTTKNDTLVRMTIPGGKKKEILEELRRLNINEFSIYDDLDHLSREIKRTRDLLF